MFKVSAQTREELGKKAKRVSKENMIPGVVYKSNTESQTIKVLKGEILKLLREATTTTIIDLEVDGKGVKALVKQVDFDPIYDEPRHISFFELNDTDVLTIDVPVRLEGISPAVKNNLGVLITPNTSIEVKCTVANLMNEVVIDISTLETPGQTVTVADIALPEGVTLLHKDQTDRALVSVGEVQKLADVAEGTVADGAAEAEAE